MSRVRRPDFMIIGSMKSGTTTLYQYLGRHPAVFMSTPKEPMFFSRDEVRSRGLDWYFSLFKGARDDQLCGEASTCYTRWPYFGDVSARIHETVPDAKFIYIMRHPVERTYSHYRHEMEERQAIGGGNLVTFDQALVEQPVIFETSLYHVQISRFLEQFPRDRFLLLFLEDLNDDPAPVLDATQRFLGLRQDDALLQSKVVANTFGSVRAKVDRLRFLDMARKMPGAPVLKKLLPAGVRAQLRAGLTRYSPATVIRNYRIKSLERKLTPLDSRLRSQLLERFAEPNRALERLMGRALPRSWHE